MNETLIRIVAALYVAAPLALQLSPHAFAQDEDTLSHLRTEVLTALREMRPDQDFRADPDDETIILSSSHSLGIAGLFVTLRNAPDASRDEMIARYLARVLPLWESTGSTQLTIRSEELRTVLRSADHVAHLHEIGKPVIARPVAGDVHAMLIRVLGEDFHTIPPSTIPERTQIEMLDTGLANIAALLEDVSIEGDGDLALYTIETEPGSTASLTLVPAFWTLVRERFGDDFIFAMPRLDQIAVLDARDPRSVERAARLILVSRARENPLLSKSIFTLEGDQIVTIWPPS